MNRHAVATLWQLEVIRTTHRLSRFVSRLRSPRQSFASLLAVLFVGLYLLAGLTVLARRDTVDPDRLQLWLSGGMICYALYHVIKYTWAQSGGGMTATPKAGDPLTPAMGLWIHGGPLPREIVSLQEIARLIPSTAAKTSLLCVVLFRDVPSLVCLWVGVFLALGTLEWIRHLVNQVVDGLDTRQRMIARAAAGLAAIALVTQIGIQTWFRTPGGSDPAQYMVSLIAATAEFAMSTPVQLLATPLQPASHLAVCEPIALIANWVPANWQVVHSGISLFLAVGFLAAMLFAYVRLDRWSLQKRHLQEQRRLATWQDQQVRTVRTLSSRKSGSGSRQDFRGSPNRSKLLTSSATSVIVPAVQGWLGRVHSPSIMAVMTRQWHCLMRYRVNVIVSFAIPMVVSLSPLLTNESALVGQATKQWIFVIGGIALSTLLLAPPALQIDFRRDLKRMWLLRSLPVKPLTMCVAMISLPVIVTSLFQWTTLAMAYAIAAPPLHQVTWLAMTLPALSVMTFAIENALFLTFPHHIHDQGIAMVIRAKVTFLWKGVLLLLFPVLLYAWALMCFQVIPTRWCSLVAYAGGVLVFWLLAFASIIACAWAWKRYDPNRDTPVE